jgi:serine/threonine-protein kinase
MQRFWIGTAFLGRYVLLRTIGRGGVSIVYEAIDTRHTRRVAIKMLDTTHAGDTAARERICREAMLTARARHPGVPKVHDYGETTLADGTVMAYIVLERLAGTTLARRLADGPLPWLDAIRAAASLADVLVAAHRRGIVHRDLSPSNIMMTPAGAKIIDFGMAITVERAESGPFVLPPAPAANDFAGSGDPADDIYALGSVLHEMLTGRSAHLSRGEAPPAPAAAAFLAPSPVLDVPGLPLAVGDMVRACMARQPAERPDAPAVSLQLWSLLLSYQEEPTRQVPTPPLAPW